MSANPVTSCWQPLTAAAVLGTGRGVAVTLPDEGELGRLCAALPGDRPELRLLHAAGVISIYMTAGTRAKAQHPSAGSTESAADTACASLRSAGHLRQILEGHHTELLADWCAAAVRSRKRAPEELLPALLTALAQHFHEAWVCPVVAVLGERGRWLAERHPEAWKVTAGFARLEAAWEDAPPAQRPRLLRAMRRTGAAAARDFLENQLGGASAEERSAWVAALETNLSAGDESFLEGRLDDGSKAVRGAAAELLARLAASPFCRRMAERRRALISVRLRRKLLGGKRIELAVTLPEPSKGLERDGVENRKQGDLGNKAWMLAQIVGASPLDTWADASPTDLLESAGGSEWCDALMLGWSMAAGRQQDAAWAEALLVAMFEAKPKEVGSPTQEVTTPLVRALPPKQREELLRGRLGTAHPPLTGSAVWPALLACEHAWSDAWTRDVFAAVHRHLASIGSNWDARLHPAHAERIAVHAAPRVAAAEVDLWPASGGDWSASTRRWADELIRVVRLRAEYLKELTP